MRRGVIDRRIPANGPERVSRVQSIFSKRPLCNGVMGIASISWADRKCGRLREMISDADRVIGEILRADDLFLSEIGRLTLAFSFIEESLASNAVDLLQIMSDNEMSETAVKKITQLRILEKRDFLKKVYGDLSRFYDIDHGRIGKILDELGNINRLRRAVVHGWIRWSTARENPVLIDSRRQLYSPACIAWRHA